MLTLARVTKVSQETESSVSTSMSVDWTHQCQITLRISTQWATTSALVTKVIQLWNVCFDVDECSTVNHECHTYAGCRSDGSYSCSCLAGYTGDGIM